jgi:hypothetical protein
MLEEPPRSGLLEQKNPPERAAGRFEMENHSRPPGDFKR